MLRFDSGNELLIHAMKARRQYLDLLGQYCSMRLLLRTETRLTRLLETCRRIGVWPDSIQVPGGMLSSRLPTGLLVWLSSGLRSVGRRGEAWLERGLPSS